MLFEEIKYAIRRFLKARHIHLAIIGVILFFILIRRIFILQIVNGDTYKTDFSAKSKITQSVSGAKGNIYDRNGKLLAYNELAYTIKICDSGIYEDNEDKNNKLNITIYKMIKIIESNGDTVDIDFPLSLDGNNNYYFTVDENEKLRFFRDIFGKTSVTLLSDEEKKYDADDTIEYLSDRFGVAKSFSKSDTLKIVYFRNLMSNSSYQRYLEFTVAKEVSDKTVAAIMENSEELTGVTVKEDYVRKYVDGLYYAHIIGYTGRVSQDQLSELLAYDKQYEPNDIVGKAGIEEAMELYLTGDKGYRDVFVDNVGRVTEVIKESKAKRGNDIYLSIDATLQKDIYHEIERQLSSIILSKIIPGGDDEKYVYTAFGTVDDVFIPINDVYFALIDNNVISIDVISTEPTNIQKGINQAFLKRREDVIAGLYSELSNEATPMNKLSKETYAYQYYIYQYLLNNEILTRSKLDTDDPMYKAWFNDEISLKEFLTYALSKNWINMSDLADNEYQSLYEAYDSLLKYIFAKLPKDDGFSKKIYQYLVKNGTISGRELCAVLFEQKIIPENENDYNRLVWGQMSAYDFIRSKIEKLEITPAQLALKPCSASVVVTSPVTGELLALVSYPSYDNNMLSGTVDPVYYKKLREDKSLPLIHRATAALCAPGSTYKINSTIAGVCEGVVTQTEILPCEGVYTKVTPSPHCWLYPGAHGGEDARKAITDSCNNYFYEIGYRLSIDPNGKFNNELGTSRLQKYTDMLGLSTLSGIEIYEATPNASNVNSIASAIGQGNNNYAPIHMARYVTTIASKGTVYNFTLINRIVDSDGKNVYTYAPKIENTCDVISDSLWDTIYTGMRGVVTPYYFFNTLEVDVAGKTGTAQENAKEPTHSLFISFAPYQNPEITVSSVIQNGYKSYNAQVLTAQVYRIIYEQERDNDVVVAPGNSVTD